MKRVVSLFFITIAMLLWLVTIIVPHHHHNGIPCFVREVCKQDHHINDSHTHHHDSQDADHHNHCAADSEFFASHDDSKIKVFLDKEVYINHFFFPLYLLLNENQFKKEGNLFYLHFFNDFIVQYKIVDTNRFDGLRAPPFSLS
jgi:hypothetical protein